jgi:hypothetical protein
LLVGGWLDRKFLMANFPKLPAVSHWPKIVLYVQNTFKTFYFRSSCSRDDERSEESCEHDDWPTTEIVSIGNDRS